MSGIEVVSLYVIGTFFLLASYISLLLLFYVMREEKCYKELSVGLLKPRVSIGVFTRGIMTDDKRK